jgi:hypothetical protein
VPRLHYMVPPEPRLPEARGLVRQGMYFVVHAPRQSGKTTTLSALATDLTAEGEAVALRFSCERAKVANDDYAAAELQVLEAIAEAADEASLTPELMPPSPWPQTSPGSRIRAGLTAWARSCRRPLVLFFDEIDALRGESLISVLAQLRDGYSSRPENFPSSIVLCGLRDVRDYKAASGGDPARLGTSSPFNIKVGSLQLNSFTPEQVTDLYWQHTAETGQEFTPEASERAYNYTQGQPWLVNALAYEIIDRMGITGPVLPEHVDTAKERLILARATHLDSLAARLSEPRVKKIIEPLIAGTIPPLDTTYDDDASYVQDLGLIARGNPVRVANPIYKEVIIRVLGAAVERIITDRPQAFLLPDGRLDIRKMLEAFAAFWKENGDIIAGSMEYHEVAPQLVLMAFLHRIVNGGGYIDREYGLGRGRTDLLIRKPYGDGQLQKEALELKVWRRGRKDPLDEGLDQLDQYLSRLGLDHGTLVIFDRRDPEPASEGPAIDFSDTTTPADRTVTLLRA